MSPTILRALRPKKSCVIQHQVCPTQTCNRKKQVKKLFISDLPCALSCAGYEGAEGRKDASWRSISTGLCHLGKKVAVEEEGESQQGAMFRRVMSMTRVEAPFLERWAICFLREGCGFLVSLQHHHPLPLVLFYLLPAFKENPGGEIFRWVKQGSLFLQKAVFRVFLIHKPFENLGEEKKKTSTLQK